MNPATMLEIIQSIRSPKAARPSEVRARLDDLTKPPGSLGLLEATAVRLARVYGHPPPCLIRRAVFVFAADHGVAVQRVSAYPAEVTSQMCRVLGDQSAAINVLARATHTRVIPVDIGVNCDDRDFGIVDRRIARGTQDLSVCDAMSEVQAIAAITCGYEIATAELKHLDIVGIGEVGIGNTTAAAALTAALVPARVADVVGRGTGVDDEALERKRHVVATALARVEPHDEVLRRICRLGGLEIAAMIGVIVAAAQQSKAILLDGFVATASALAAVRLNPALRNYCIAAHLSPEPGHRVQLKALRLRPLLRLQMRLGEGTGAALAFPIVEAASRLLSEMATFSGAAVSARSDP
jgi:nicotinate-nucleotide--dimethylbenzimidazole phosphoribosyltransferase